MSDYSNFYTLVEKPFFAPPEWLFGVAWGVIYPLIIISFVWAFFLVIKGRIPFLPLGVFVLNMFGNLAFTPILFERGIPTATLTILFVFSTLAFLQYYFYRNARIIFWLLLPYLLWAGFASMLQVSIYFLN